MKPPAFAYYRPETVQEALQLLQKVNDAKILAGGQSLIPMLNMRLARPAAVIDINRLRELTEIQEYPDHLLVGALVRHYQLMESPLVRRFAPVVAEAERHIGHAAIRTRGTIGGSLSHADPAAELPLLATLGDWELDVASATGARVVPAREFFLGYLMTALGADELVTHIRIPKATGVSRFSEFSLRAGDFALVSAAVSLNLDAHQKIDHLRLALGGVGETPWREPAIEAHYRGSEASPNLWTVIATEVADLIDPPEDLHASAAYRRQLARALLEKTLAETAADARRTLTKGGPAS